jgi:ABC-type multidrug transport system fused ATPase/permease subunit
MNNETIKNERLQRRSEKWYPIFEKLFGYEKKVKILPVDFNKPWWQIIWDQKWQLAFCVAYELVDNVYQALIPIIIAFILTTGNYSYFFYFIIVAVSLQILGVFVFIIFSLLEAKTTYSVYSAANKFFLTVDPINHSTRSSGQIISKTSRGSERFEDILQMLLYDIIPIFATLITIVVAMVKYDFNLGIIAFLGILFVALVSVATRYWITPMLSKKSIEVEDDFKATGVETLAQVAHIRASFASKEQNDLLSEKTKKLMAVRTTTSSTGVLLNTSIRVFYILTVLIVGLVMLNSVSEGKLNLVIAIGLLISYAGGMKLVNGLGKVVEKFSDRVSKANDLFIFIRGFGKQTYPVLEGDVILENEKGYLDVVKGKKSSSRQKTVPPIKEGARRAGGV